MDVRCPTDDHLIGVVAESIVGRVRWPCRHCKQYVAVGDGSDVDARLLCACKAWLATGFILSGVLILSCRKCGVLSAIDNEGGHPVEVPRKGPLRPRPPKPQPVDTDPYRRPARLRDDEILARIEDRWRDLRVARTRRSIEIAVGLRFDVFNRDGFRCVYCGRGPAQGVYLEADHRIARANGGLDTMANLVTACWDCNRGKSAKVIAS